MRQALFAVVLVAASFAGGAAVNGPGLKWAQTALLSRIGFGGDDAPAPAGADGPTDDFPASPIPPLAVDSASNVKPGVTARTKPDAAPSPPAAPREVFGDSRPKPSDDDKAARAAFAGDVTRVADPRPTPTPTPEPAPTAADPADWQAVRKALRDLGAARYGTEGEPGGRVRFHCVIPLAGRRAVGQHFEAEGDDDLPAARAALRRVALWRASGDDR